MPRSAGATMKSVLTTCLGKVIATDVGGIEGHHLDERLEVINKPHGLFLNVDTTTTQGLKHAKSLGKRSFEFHGKRDEESFEKFEMCIFCSTQINKFSSSFMQ